MGADPPYLLAVLRVDQPAPHERPQEAAPDLGLYGFGVGRIQLVHPDETHTAVWVRRENAV